jgi:hypothetical protein
MERDERENVEGRVLDFSEGIRCREYEEPRKPLVTLFKQYKARKFVQL